MKALIGLIIGGACGFGVIGMLANMMANIQDSFNSVGL